jgi:cytochrome c oxidase assembly protein subunit 19
MSAGGAFGGARGLQAKAPEKGVFPLDHFGECTEVDYPIPKGYRAGIRCTQGSGFARHCFELLQEKERYMECLQRNKMIAENCTDIAKSYLECRMDRCVPTARDRCADWCHGPGASRIENGNDTCIYRQLMAKQSLRDLGLEGLYQPEKHDVVPDTSRSTKGFVAGVRSESGVQESQE